MNYIIAIFSTFLYLRHRKSCLLLMVTSELHDKGKFPFGWPNYSLIANLVPTGLNFSPREEVLSWLLLPFPCFYTPALPLPAHQRKLFTPTFYPAVFLHNTANSSREFFLVFTRGCEEYTTCASSACRLGWSSWCLHLCSIPEG